MTHEEFHRLYDNGEIELKIYTGIVDGAEKAIEAFTYNGKYYLRIHSVYRYVTGKRSNGKSYKMTRESHFIREFDTKEHANAYFRKAADGLQRY